MSSPLIAWDQICREKKQGGLGIKKVYEFNIASIAKYVWWLANKKDHLWVKWVNVVYLRGQSWTDCQPSSSTTWAWRRICKVRDKMIDGFCDGWWLTVGNEYTVRQGYEWLCPSDAAVSWHSKVWRDTLCCLCAAAPETSQHLFFECPYSSSCVQIASRRLRMTIPVTDTWVWWDQTIFPSMFHKKVFGAVICALIYHVWKARNHSYHNLVLVRPEVWIKSLIPEIIFRCRSVVSAHIMSKYGNWINSL
ncbi:hypothetical protein RND81_03G029300 [Saponaria officinalis]|uniref:Reverse transcriptase zinc-binding domain-containing protein n=1 Tax=Saponaria officinalis TaxID=3572 RepID=A0AAW1M263_SAPOF